MWILLYKVKPGIVYPDHDPDQPWKDMVPILGMKFKDHEEMKMMLANYGVANGYQLWYKRNDYKSLLVLCGRNVKEGRCASKVGRKGKGKEKVAEGKGKEKVAKGKGKKKVAEGSKVVEAAYAFQMKDPAEGVSDFYNKKAWQNCYSSFIKPVGGQSMWVKTGLPPSMPPKKRVMPGRPKGKRQKHPSKGKKGGQSGFESAASALKRRRMDATASGSGSGLSEEEDANPANADHANADPANANHANADPVNVDHANADLEEMEHVEMEQVEMEHVEMEEPMHIE
ncbi:hypothetical protein Tco_0913084 [Tanacetum coccineum]